MMFSVFSSNPNMKSRITSLPFYEFGGLFTFSASTFPPGGVTAEYPATSPLLSSCIHKSYIFLSDDKSEVFITVEEGFRADNRTKKRI